MTTKSISSEKAAFDGAFNRIQEVIPFDKSFSNGTGYFDNAVRYDLANGKEVKMIDEYGRKAILVGTAFGTVIIFERYKVEEGATEAVYTSNYPSELARFGWVTGEGRLDANTICRIVHQFDFFDNIGVMIDKLISHVKGKM